MATNIASLEKKAEKLRRVTAGNLAGDLRTRIAEGVRGILDEAAGLKPINGTTVQELERRASLLDRCAEILEKVAPSKTGMSAPTGIVINIANVPKEQLMQARRTLDLMKG